jgi:type I restriction enzyme, S subunit
LIKDNRHSLPDQGGYFCVLERLMVFIAGVTYMRVKLEDVCERGSSNIKQSDIIKMSGNYPIYGASGLAGKVNFYHQEQPYVAVVKDGAGIGRTTLNPAKSSVIGTMQYLIPKKNVLPEYLFYVVSYMHLEKYYTGATIPHIYFKDYKNEEFNLDNIEKQLEIIDVLGRCKKVIEARKQELVELDSLTKARFVEMFGNPVTNEKGWKQRQLGEITTKIGSGATPKGGKEAYQEEGITLIRSMNVHNGLFEYKELAHISEEQAEKLDNVTIEENDVLLNITGASVARSCVVPSKILPARVNQHVCIIRCNQCIVPEFLNKLLIDDNYQRLLWSIAEAGATREAITKQQVESLQIIMPPIELQEQFADFVHQVDKSKVAVQKALDETQILFDSLMQKYFG